MGAGVQLIQEQAARVLPGSGIDLNHFAPAEYPAPGQPPTFLLIGRLLRDKGVREFVEAASLVKQVHPEARFELLGPVDAQNRSSIDSATLAEWEKTRVIEYLAPCEDVREHIARAHCVVLPSYREGAPRSLIEAAAMARPLITTDVPGCRSVVEDCASGFLCAVHSGESLAQACLRFIELPRQAQIDLGSVGRAKMEREFDEAIVIAAYQHAIADVVENR